MKLTNKYNLFLDDVRQLEETFFPSEVEGEIKAIPLRNWTVFLFLVNKI